LQDPTNVWLQLIPFQVPYGQYQTAGGVADRQANAPFSKV
jgi:hypothetical protein